MNPRWLADLVFGGFWRLEVSAAPLEVVAESPVPTPTEPPPDQVSVDEMVQHIMGQVEQRLQQIQEQHQVELRPLHEGLNTVKKSVSQLGTMLQDWSKTAEGLKNAPKQIGELVRKIEFLVIYCHYLNVGSEVMAININPLLEDAPPVPESVVTMVEQNRVQYEARLFEMAQRLSISMPSVNQPMEATTQHQ